MQEAKQARASLVQIEKGHQDKVMSRYIFPLKEAILRKFTYAHVHTMYVRMHVHVNFLYIDMHCRRIRVCVIGPNDEHKVYTLSASCVI